MKKISKKAGDLSETNKDRYSKHEFRYKTDPNEYSDPLMNYHDLKNALGYIDKIKDAGDRREIRKCLDALIEITQKGASSERVGRISDYGNMNRDTYKIIEYLSDTKDKTSHSGADSLDMARRCTKSLLEKINLREEQLTGKAHRYDWMNPNNVNQAGVFLKAAAIVGISIGLIFLSPNITGNVVSDIPLKTTSSVGIGLMFIGLIASFFWIRMKKKSKK